MQHILLLALAALTTAPASQDTTSHFMVDLDEVVVVAQPKETARLRQQPVGSSIFGEKEMQLLDIKSMADISRHVPSLCIPAYGSRLTSSVYIRGIGSRTGAPAVGIYLDNIPLVEKSAYNMRFYQLDRADIMRGPQGTLYGINTEGGLMRLYTKSPATHNGSEVSLTTRLNIDNSNDYASRQPAETTVEAATFQRLTDNSAFSLSAFYTDRKGYFTNTTLSQPADEGREAGARTRLAWQPDARWRFELTADWQHTAENAFPYGLYDSDTDQWTPPSTTTSNTYRRNMLVAGIHITRQLATASLSSTTSYQLLDDRMAMDQDYLPVDLMSLEQEQRMHAITQELTFKTLSASRWQHTTGIFFSHEWLTTDAPVNFGPDMNDMIKGRMGIPQRMLAMLTMTDNAVPASFKTPHLNAGVFHETRLALTPRLTATLGLRYDMHHTAIDYDTQSHFSLGMATGQQPLNHFESALCGRATDTYSQLLPKLALTWRTDNKGSNVYASLSKGFRAGGYNMQMFADIFQTEQRTLGSQLMQLMRGNLTIDHDADYLESVAQTITYAPEESWSYEAGIHQNLDEGRLQADAAVYYMNIDNQQLSIMAGDFGRMMMNAGEASSYGAELALRGRALAEHLTWTATYSWTHSEFESEGIKRKTPFIPTHNLATSADWLFTMPAKSIVSEITVGGTLTCSGPQYWDVDNLYRQPFHALLDTRMSIAMRHLSIELRCNNLTSTRYNTFLIESAADGQRRTFAQRGLPRRITVGLKYRF